MNKGTSQDRELEMPVPICVLSSPLSQLMASLQNYGHLLANVKVKVVRKKSLKFSSHRCLIEFYETN